MVASLASQVPNQAPSHYYVEHEPAHRQARRPHPRPKHEAALKQAASWPLITARTLASKVVPKDLLAEEGTSFQTFQIETAFYFTLPGETGGYFGGHLRSQPMSDSEAHRMIPQIAEDTPVHIRYNPIHPDDNHTLAADNPNALPFPIWPF